MDLNEKTIENLRSLFKHSQRAKADALRLRVAEEVMRKRRGDENNTDTNTDTQEA